MKKVALDPGHGGRDTGARTADGRPEKESNLRVALLARDLLLGQGFDVLMTRTEDVFVDLPARCDLANRLRADVFVSLHADAAGGPGPHGHHAIHSIHSRPGEGGAKLARLLVDEVERATGRPRFPATGSFFGGPGDGTWSRPSGVNPDRDFYAVIRNTDMTAVILERGFLTNPDDAALLFDEDFLGRQARGIAQAVAAYFDVPPAGAGDPVPGEAVPDYARAAAMRLHERGILRELRGGEDFWRLVAILDRLGLIP